MSEQEVSVEQEASQMGWVPLDKFRGDPAKWVDADTFVERGHTVMPILKQNNARLEQLVRDQQAELNQLKGMVSASQESVQELQEFHRENLQNAIKATKKEIMEKLRAARESGDIDAELELEEGLTELRVQERDLKTAKKDVPTSGAKPGEKPGQGAETLHPDFKQWHQDNSWFGTDQRKTMRAMGIAQELRADPENDSLQGREFFDRIVEVMAERTGEKPASSKVSGGRPSSSDSGGSGKGGKTYNDLPADAKQACDSRANKFVGAGRAFKDIAAWRSYYAEHFFEGA